MPSNRVRRRAPAALLLLPVLTLPIIAGAPASALQRPLLRVHVGQTLTSKQRLPPPIDPALAAGGTSRPAAPQIARPDPVHPAFQTACASGPVRANGAHKSVECGAQAGGCAAAPPD